MEATTATAFNPRAEVSEHDRTVSVELHGAMANEIVVLLERTQKYPGVCNVTLAGITLTCTMQRKLNKSRVHLQLNKLKHQLLRFVREVITELRTPRTSTSTSNTATAPTTVPDQRRKPRHDEVYAV